MIDKVDFLSKVSIFSHMKKSDINRIAEIVQYHSFHDGDLIIREGDHDRQLFIIVKGKAEVIKNLGEKSEKRLLTLVRYSYFGEMALIDNLVRSASVIAREETQVLSLSQRDFRQEINKYPAMSFELLKMLSQRIRAIEKTMLNTLGSFVLICANCKRIREIDGSWTPIEKYVPDRSETEFSHGMCPECSKVLYPEYLKED
jgi:CRP-like cAMP-binding protein